MLCDYKISYIDDSGFSKSVKVRFYEGQKRGKRYIRENLLREQVFMFDAWDTQKEIVAYLNKYLKEHYSSGRQPIDEQTEQRIS